LNINDLALQDDTRVIANLVTGSNVLKFFSVDPNRNVGVVDSISFLACDNCSGPKVLDLSISNAKEVKGNYYTNIRKPVVRIRFNEPAEITTAGLSLGVNQFSFSASPSYGFNYVYTLTPTVDLSDGKYLFSLNARDKNGIFMNTPLNFDFVIDTVYPSITYMRPVDNTFLSTTEVDINVSFSEPVFLNASIDDVMFINNYVAKHIPDDISDALDNVDDMFFAGKITSLSSGKKSFHVVASDFAGNKLVADSFFFVGTQAPDFRLKHPSFGVSSTYTFDAVVETDGNAECRYLYDLPTAPPASQFAYLTSFDSTGGLDHTIHGLSIPQGDKSKHPLYVYCKGVGFDPDRKLFELSVDDSAPSIVNAFVYQKIISDYISPEDLRFMALLKVQMSEPGFCKYSAVQSDFDLMEGLFPGFGESLTVSHVINISVAQEGDYTYYIACQDIAELDTQTVSVNFSIDTSLLFSVQSLTKKYQGTSPFYLRIETNKNAFCYYGENIDAISECVGDCNFGFAHVQPVTKSTPGDYQFFVRCNNGIWGDTSDVLLINVTLDLSPPVMLYVSDDSVLNDSDYSFYSYRLRVAFFGNDSDTRVTQYLVSIEDTSTGSLVLDQVMFNVLDGKPFYINGLNLTNKTRYVVRVVPVNIAGLKGNEMVSDGVTIDFDMRPHHCFDDEINFNETDVDCGGACDPCDLGMACVENGDCALNYCVDEVCEQPACNDSAKNGFESDVDCGGQCSACLPGQSCNSDYDCVTANCESGVCSAINRCENGLLDGTETDVDCGGACPGCSYGLNCVEDYDCAEGSFCVKSVCSGEDSDEDGVPDENDACPDTPVDEIADSRGCSRSQRDLDGDGMDDSWELQYGLDPDDDSDAGRDLDRDGLSNLEEFQYGTDPTERDSDGDGWSDKDEVSRGFDPLNPDSHPKSAAWSVFIVFLIILLLIGLGVGGYFGYKYWKALPKKVKQVIRLPVEEPRPRPAPPATDKLAGLRRMVKLPARKEDKGWVSFKDLVKRIKRKKIGPDVWEKLQRIESKDISKKEKDMLIRKLRKEPVMDSLRKIAKRRKR
jgi:hypothetical protein